MRLETEFFPQNLVSFCHNSKGCAVRALQIVLFEQVLNIRLLDHSLFAHLIVTTTRKRAMNRATTNGEGVIMGFLSRTLFAHLIAPTELCE